MSKEREVVPQLLATFQHPDGRLDANLLGAAGEFDPPDEEV